MDDKSEVDYLRENILFLIDMHAKKNATNALYTCKYAVVEGRYDQVNLYKETEESKRYIINKIDLYTKDFLFFRTLYSEYIADRTGKQHFVRLHHNFYHNSCKEGESKSEKISCSKMIIQIREI